MAKIVPMKGLRYNSSKVDINEVVTPPYDVIDAKGQEDFYTKNPYNVIRLELGKTFSDDNEEKNRYTRAAAFLGEWIASGVLVNEEKPSVYLYEQEFEARGETKVRSGFIAGVQANDYSKGEVLPHEETLPKHKADRLNLMKATLANFSPIFGLYADPDHSIETVLNKAKGNQKPDAEVTDEQGVMNRLWVVSDENAVQYVVDQMASKKVFIADGHHRYETAVNFGKEMADQGKSGFDYLMICLVNLYNEGLVVFPTHRVVKNLTEFNLNSLVEKLTEDFTVEEVKGLGLNEFIAKLEAQGENAHAFGLYADSKYYLITLKDENRLDRVTMEGRSAAWRRLDVSILHTLILEKLLGIGSQQRADESNLVYLRDDDATKAAVDNGSAQLAFFMNSTRVEEVTDIATGGEKMPQKSTFFYPKVITGMVLNNYKK
ncbi:MAG: DUF1015 domain-containing protein [Thermincola sp.]|nr:DUF1015 domain-containing protein [Thermincola sp.]MDT3703223.1 DUF1015 domain-containing protein [Thermincola sp.]